METMPTAEALLALPNQCTSQTCDLHLEASFTPAFSTVRFWVSRCDIFDGEPFDTTVYVEVREYVPGRPDWYDLGHYDGTNPPESLAGYSPADLGVGAASETLGSARG